jgi:hypothetical protein
MASASSRRPTETARERADAVEPERSKHSNFCFEIESVTTCSVADELENTMKAFIFGGAFTALGCFWSAAPALANTCSSHYSSCLKYGNGPTKCGCARQVCLKEIGASKDAGPKWNWIPGLNACFK